MSKNTRYILTHFVFLLLGVILTLVSIISWRFLNNVVVGREIQSVVSPDRKHNAKLLEKSFADRNFVLKVDEVIVYVSPDFLPGYGDKLNNLNESLDWDSTGKIIVLMVKGKKIFAYNVETKSEIKE